MNLFIDTSNESFYLALIKNNQIEGDVYRETLKKKSDFLPEAIKLLFSNNEVSLEDINNIYVISGPGSFTGIKVGLLFARTVGILNNNIKIYQANSFIFITKGFLDGTHYLNAMGGTSYKYESIDGNYEITLVNKITETKKEGYEDFKSRIAYYLSKFTIIPSNDLVDFEPLYIKNPRIGGN